MASRDPHLMLGPPIRTLAVISWVWGDREVHQSPSRSSVIKPARTGGCLIRLLDQFMVSDHGITRSGSFGIQSGVCPFPGRVYHSRTGLLWLDGASSCLIQVLVTSGCVVLAIIRDGSIPGGSSDPDRAWFAVWTVFVGSPSPRLSSLPSNEGRYPSLVSTVSDPRPRANRGIHPQWPVQIVTRTPVFVPPRGPGRTGLPGLGQFTYRHRQCHGPQRSWPQLVHGS